MQYFVPDTLEEVLARLHQLGGEARVIAGGQDIVPLMNQGKLLPISLIDVKRLRAKAAIAESDCTLIISVLCTHRSIENSTKVRSRCCLLADAAAQIGGGVEVRNRG